MKHEYRVHWHQCPHNRFDPHVMYVMADDKIAAEAIAKDHIERTYGIEWFKIKEITKYTRPTGGYVVSGAPQDGEL
jgi:hypothetical protein